MTFQTFSYVLYMAIVLLRLNLKGLPWTLLIFSTVTFASSLLSSLRNFRIARTYTIFVVHLFMKKHILLKISIELWSKIHFYPLK